MNKIHLHVQNAFLVGVATILMFGISACNQQELERLRAENAAFTTEIAALKTKASALEIENAKLKETDQAYFNKGVDTFTTAKTLAEIKTAHDILKQLVLKFPLSPLVPQANTNISKMEHEIDRVSRLEAVKEQFQSSFAAHNFAAASASLKLLKGSISASDYKGLETRLYEEKHKPIETTINKLVSQFGSYKGNGQIDRALGMVDMRVKLEATFTSINRDRKELDADSEGWGKGSSISVFYEGTNAEEFFTNADPKCCNNRYEVIGVVKMFSNADHLYIKAEKIGQLHE